MGNVAGDILEINYNHPTLGSGVFYPKSAEDNSINLGGFRANDDKNMVTAGGEMITQLNNTLWSVETTIAWDPNVRNDAQKVADLAADPEDATYTFTHISGTVWGGKGRPVGDSIGNLNTGTLPIKLSGGKKLEKQ